MEVTAALPPCRTTRAPSFILSSVLKVRLSVWSCSPHALMHLQVHPSCMPRLPSEGDLLQEAGCAKEGLGSVVPFGLGQCSSPIGSSWSSNVDRLVCSN